MGQIIKSLLSFSQSVYGRNFDSILMKFCTVIQRPKCKIEFVWDKNLLTFSPILPHFLKNLHYGLWRLQSGNSIPVKDNCTLCLLTSYFRGQVI